MTLAQVITKTINRCRVDLDSDVDTADNDAMTLAVVQAAKEWSRDTLCLWTWRSTLTLSDGDFDYDLISAAAVPVFRCYGVHINGQWLSELLPQNTQPGGENEDYWNRASSSNPNYWFPQLPTLIRLYEPPNATAVAASDNFVIGFHEHAVYTHAANQGTEMQGPAIYHDLIADRAALNIAISYVSSEEGVTRYRMIEERYLTKCEKLYSLNESVYRKRSRRGMAGETRRVFDV